ncbi:4-hydroxy-3-methylbut-2-enyl diphosphate reductase [Kiloniella sp.]|uniref:4-hydroxy-3-methylbut-2-enyl diphosphate reductase n=1 Tax=Kiloniella sp. TaxID=1938587 RepID=UPI003B026290
MTKPTLTVLLASPRGFCAGVDRAIEIVERALVKHGAPVYVRHEIVHNRYVVENLEQKGAIFVQEIDEVPEGLPVIFSAHGVPKSVPAAAQARELLYFDATCPLVSKVHREAERHEKDGRQVILIGHAGHPEVIGTMGQIDEGSIVLVETEQDAEQLEVPDPENLAYVTQTTLSVDDTASIVKVLLRRFPNMLEPKKEDICYATTNRQEAVKAIAKRCDALLVIGAPNSSNSKRLVEVAFKQGCEKSALVQRAVDIKWDQLSGVSTLGITAGASAPEILVEEVIAACNEHFDVTIEEINIRDENVVFRVPKTLLDTTANKEIH